MNKTRKLVSVSMIIMLLGFALPVAKDSVISVIPSITDGGIIVLSDMPPIDSY